jgi:uncharacterized repeat protein (TIGR01451 family)
LNDGGVQGGTPGHFSTGQRLDNSSGFDTALGDLDGDGDLDAFVANWGANKVWLNQLAPVLTIRKTAPATMVPGSLITYTLTISNTGTATATNPLILDRIPAGAHYVSGGSLNLPFVSWEVGELAPYSGIVSVHFVVTATETIINSDYRVSATGGYTATGSVPVVTVALQHSTYLPVVLRNF